MKRSWLSVTLFLLTLGPVHHGWAGDERRLVLVTDKSSGIGALTTSEIRRLFLGLPVKKEGKMLEAAINQSDPLLYQVFLQKVVFMSAPVYERHLLENVIQLGGQRPQSFNNPDALAADIHQHPGTVSYMWNHTLQSYPYLVIVGELWHPHGE